MPSVGASVDGIPDSLVFLRLVVEVVKEVEELLARVDGGVMAQQREVRVVLRVVDVEVERHVAGIALEQHLQVVHARVVEQGGVDVDGEPLYALVLHVVHEFHALDDQLQAVGRVGESLSHGGCDVYDVLLLQHVLPLCPFVAEERQLALTVEVFDGDDAERLVVLRES